MVHKISIEKMSQERHAASSSQSKVFGLLNGHGFGLFPTGTGGRAAAYHAVDEEEDALGYRFGTRRGRGRTLTGGMGRNVNVSSCFRRDVIVLMVLQFGSRGSRNALLVVLAIGLAFLLGRHLAPSSRIPHHQGPAPPFLIPPSAFPPLTREQQLALLPTSTDRTLYPSPLAPEKPGHVVPNVVHYVYGLKDNGRTDGKGDEFPYYAYLAIRSALVNIKPEKVYL
jgi:hypothetical protein